MHIPHSFCTGYCCVAHGFSVGGAKIRGRGFFEDLLNGSIRQGLMLTKDSSNSPFDAFFGWSSLALIDAPHFQTCPQKPRREKVRMICTMLFIKVYAILATPRVWVLE
jgi:hypothetical protein